MIVVSPGEALEHEHRQIDAGIESFTRAAGEDTFTYGEMHQRQACQAAKIERALPQVAARTDT